MSSIPTQQRNDMTPCRESPVYNPYHEMEEKNKQLQQLVLTKFGQKDYEKLLKLGEILGRHFILHLAHGEGNDESPYIKHLSKFKTFEEFLSHFEKLGAGLEDWTCFDDSVWSKFSDDFATSVREYKKTSE